MIFRLLGNTIWRCQHSFAFGLSSKEQIIRGLYLWCISIKGRSFADWVAPYVDLVRLGLQGFLCLPPFFPWASFAGLTRALFEGALRLHVLQRKSTCSFSSPYLFSSAQIVLVQIIELVTSASTSYMITVHSALGHPFLAILSPN